MRRDRELRDFPVLDGTVRGSSPSPTTGDTTAADLVAALEADPTFAANLLRYANSATMARPIRAKTVRQAVMLVGRKALRRLALETATYRFFERAPGNGRAAASCTSTRSRVAGVAAAAAEQVRAHGDGAAPRRPAARHGQARPAARLRRGGVRRDQRQRARAVPSASCSSASASASTTRFAGALLAERGASAPTSSPHRLAPRRPDGRRLPEPRARLRADRRPGRPHGRRPRARPRPARGRARARRAARHRARRPRPALAHAARQPPGRRAELAGPRATETERLSQTDELTGATTAATGCRPPAPRSSSPAGPRRDPAVRRRPSSATSTATTAPRWATSCSPRSPGSSRPRAPRPPRPAGCSPLGARGRWPRGPPRRSSTRSAPPSASAPARPNVEVSLGLGEAGTQGAEPRRRPRGRAGRCACQGTGPRGSLGACLTTPDWGSNSPRSATSDGVERLVADVVEDDDEQAALVLGDRPLAPLAVAHPRADLQAAGRLVLLGSGRHRSCRSCRTAGRSPRRSSRARRPAGSRGAPRRRGP